MTTIKIGPETILVNFLRDNLTDINASRSGQFVFDDWPRLEDLGDASYPRISIINITDSSISTGAYDDNQYHTVILQIDCWAKKDLGFTRTITDEALGTMASTANSDRLVYDFVPTAVTNIKHDGSAYGTVTLKDKDSDFTTPASLAAGTVEVSKSTGNLNFSAADVSSHNTDAITSTYTLFLEGQKCAKYYAREIIKLIRANWRTSLFPSGLKHALMVGNNPIPFDEKNDVFRHMIQYQFNAVNIGEGI